MKAKRRWSWTNKNLRKSRNPSSHWYSPPKDFRRTYNGSIKAYFKTQLHNEVYKEKENIVYPLRTWRSSATWEWM